MNTEEKPSSQANALSACKKLFRWLQEYTRSTDASIKQRQIPKKDLCLPDITSETQINGLLSIPDTDTAYGVRNNILLEVMYTTGLRISTVVNLYI
ncbi:hypothetical protein [Snodgrassella sp. ESL0253]|uniref:hypothetical protein n=1 Tax=Snodgrassella sp. ESL0253 TaxID=2705031 RepID=UPI001581E730|nr:hypothetical protein [Snodgrassella sp. ESL0253]NUE66575.1 hypothetical protein [Snodgrassella sp. ESL0253]